MQWFRSHHGAPTDPKWRVIARKAQCRPGDVVAIFWALLDFASQQTDRGSVAGVDRETMAAAFDFDEEMIAAVIRALEEKGVIKNGRLTAWEKRQPKRDDGSAERSKEWRERNRPQANADEHPEQREQIESREESEKKASPRNAPRKRGTVLTAEQSKLFEAWYALYPRHTARIAAERAYLRALALASPEELIAGVTRYCAACAGKEERFIAHPSTWLNQGRWQDENGRANAGANGSAHGLSERRRPRAPPRAEDVADAGA